MTTFTKYFFAGGGNDVIDTNTIIATKKYYLIAGKRIAVEDSFTEEYATARDYIDIIYPTI